MSVNDLVVDSSVSSLIQDLVTAANSGGTGDFTVSKKGSKITVTLDSENGEERFTNSQETVPGLQRTVTERAQKLPIEQRRQLVKHLHKNEKLTQEEIKERTLTSQKTVCNDLKHLRKNGEI